MSGHLFCAEPTATGTVYLNMLKYFHESMPPRNVILDTGVIPLIFFRSFIKLNVYTGGIIDDVCKLINLITDVAEKFERHSITWRFIEKNNNLKQWLFVNKYFNKAFS